MQNKTETLQNKKDVLMTKCCGFHRLLHAILHIQNMKPNHDPNFDTKFAQFEDSLIDKKILLHEFLILNNLLYRVSSQRCTMR